jgi:hypothetical protein
MPERHTGQNIAERLTSIMNNHHIPLSSIIAVVKDNARNMTCALNLLNESFGWKCFGQTCFGHSLQLVVNDALKWDEIKDGLIQARKLVGHVRHSALATHNLLSVSKSVNGSDDNSDDGAISQDDGDDEGLEGVGVGSGLKLVQDVKTRWNSTYDMCARLAKQRWNIAKVCSNLLLLMISITV